ncbi:MAG TPA: cytochrome c biogenesis protein CcdA [Candidatus Limnocylindria bacterium]|nr:cytochrome c biogenesis protein CcdA [Candidatus Limnocylindria bacterium]
MGELLGAVALGVGATITPCILPLYPAFLAFLTGSAAPAPLGTGAAVATVPRATLPPLVAATLVWAGVVAGMVAIGALFALFAASLTPFIAVVLPVADLLLILLGALLLAGRNPFARLPQLAPAGLGRSGPAVGALAYGLLFAPIALPCSGPFLVGIFAFSLTLGDVVAQLGFFLAFGVGFGLPLFVLGVLGQARGAQLARALVRHERPLQLVVGAALVAVGIWDLAQNLPALLR